MAESMNTYRYTFIENGTHIASEVFQARSDRAAKLSVTEIGTIKKGIPPVYQWGSRWYTVNPTLFEKTCKDVSGDVRVILERLFGYKGLNLEELPAFTYDS